MRRKAHMDCTQWLTDRKGFEYMSKEMPLYGYDIWPSSRSHGTLWHDTHLYDTVNRMKVYSISILIHNDKSIEAETIKEYESLIKDGGCIILCIEKSYLILTLGDTNMALGHSHIRMWQYDCPKIHKVEIEANWFDGISKTK